FHSQFYLFPRGQWDDCSKCDRDRNLTSAICLRHAQLSHQYKINKAMKILVLNAGSSSQKSCLYDLIEATLPKHR
ncbi:MAG TPA: hypothetical protein DCP31_36180, partial [Cyanobacteria bacterium UBA8543]|nr:hypothetical protein [Cyanobacteria bacterium UBA8543]